MIESLTMLVEDPEVEIAALVRTLHETQQRLQELSGGEVDAVIHPGGQFYLLHEAQEKLRRSEERFTGAFEYAPIGIALVSPGGRWLKVNRALCALVGYTEAELLTRTFQSITHPEDLSTDLENLHQLLAGNALSYQMEKRYVHACGQFVSVLLHVSLVRDDEGAPSYFIAQIQDVTERKRIEEALRESEARFRGTFEQAAVGIAHESPEGRFLRVNDKLCAIVGYPREELLAMDCADLTLPEDLARSHAGRLALLTGEQSSFTTEKRYRRKDGTVVWTNLVATVERSVTGEPEYLISVFEDITARKEAENEVRFNEQRYRSLVEATTAIVWDTPASGEFEVEQPGWSSFTGQTFAELSGSGWLQAIHPEDREETARVWSAAVASRSTYHIEHRLRAHDGTYHNMTMRGVPIFAEDGTIVQWIGIHTDITERKKLEQHFLRAQRMESIGTLAGGIAHDLNNSLTPIIMSLDLLKLRFADPKSRELLEIVSTSAQRGADMVRQVLSFGRGVESERHEVKIRHLVRDIEKISNDTFLKHIEVRTSIPNDLWTVVGDATQLHQVLLNLCVNARDAMPSGGTLTVSAENLALDSHYAALNPDAHAGAYVMLQVEDTGIGIPTEVIEKIFDPFFTTKEFGKGTGLGLSTSLAIVKSHEGFLRVYSELGKGTTFKVYLPARIESSAGTTTGRAVELPRGNGELILVIDDESSVRRVTQQTLEAFGYRVVLAAEGAEAVALYATRSAEIAVVLADMMMPIMDGPATIQILRKLNPRLPIIAVSGLVSNDHMAKFANLGVQHFLPKPYTAETLLKVLNQLLGKTNALS